MKQCYIRIRMCFIVRTKKCLWRMGVMPYIRMSDIFQGTEKRLWRMSVTQFLRMSDVFQRIESFPLWREWVKRSSEIWVYHVSQVICDEGSYVFTFNRINLAYFKWLGVSCVIIKSDVFVRIRHVYFGRLAIQALEEDVYFRWLNQQRSHD